MDNGNREEQEIVIVRPRFSVPWGTRAILGLESAGFLLCLFFPDFISEYFLIHTGKAESLLKFWSFITASFIVNVALMLVFSIILVLSLVRMVEIHLGTRRFIMYYAVTAIAGSIAVWILFPKEMRISSNMMVFYAAAGALWHLARSEEWGFFIISSLHARARTILIPLLLFMLLPWILTGFLRGIAAGLLSFGAGYGAVRLFELIDIWRITRKASASGNKGKSKYIEMN